MPTQKEACPTCPKAKKLKPKWTKKSAISAMTSYLDELIRRSVDSEKRAAVCRINQLAGSLQQHGDLFTALEDVYPEKTAADRSRLAVQLVARCQKSAGLFWKDLPVAVPIKTQTPKSNFFLDADRLQPVKR